MTNQFKFGDRVIDKDTRLGECVVINASEKFVYVMNEQGNYNVLARPETLEIVPHPDTVRLAFIAKETEHALEELRDAIDDRITAKGLMKQEAEKKPVALSLEAHHHAQTTE